jgi:hypothetical protein
MRINHRGAAIERERERKSAFHGHLQRGEGLIIGEKELLIILPNKIVKRSSFSLSWSNKTNGGLLFLLYSQMTGPDAIFLH